MKQLKLFEASEPEEAGALNLVDQTTRKELLTPMARVMVTIQINQTRGEKNDEWAADKNHGSAS